MQLRTINNIIRRLGFVLVVGCAVDDDGNVSQITLSFERASKHPLLEE